jgi:DNA-binding XRE family transcriptional regulator
MSAHTPDSVQIIEKDGHPIFAVIPYEDYLNLLPKDERTTVPHEVVGLVVKEGMNLVRAWRQYLGLTQAEISRRAGISQAALSQMERADNKLRNSTLEKLARAMGLSIDQLTD